MIFSTNYSSFSGVTAGNLFQLNVINQSIRASIVIKKVLGSVFTSDSLGVYKKYDRTNFYINGANQFQIPGVNLSYGNANHFFSENEQPKLIGPFIITTGSTLQIGFTTYMVFAASDLISIRVSVFWDYLNK